MTSKTPPTRASRRPNPPKAPTTPPANAPARPKAEGEVTLAVITGAHGVTGEVRLKLFTDNLARYKTFNRGALTVKSLRATPQGAIARFAEVSDRTTAEALRGTELAVPRAALPPLDEGEYYHADLIGLAAESDSGAPLGHVVAVENFGAGDVLEIERPDGKRFMVPMRPEAVPHWDEARLVVSEAFASA